jgi:hypothetical protein
MNGCFVQLGSISHCPTLFSLPGLGLLHSCLSCESMIRSWYCAMPCVSSKAALTELVRDVVPIYLRNSLQQIRP